MNQNVLLIPRLRRCIACGLLLSVTGGLLDADPNGEKENHTRENFGLENWQDRLVLSYRKAQGQKRGSEELHHNILIENPNQQESMRRLADLYESKNEYFLARVINRYLLKRNLRDRKLLMQRERLARKLAEQPEKEVTAVTIDVVKEFTERALAQDEVIAVNTMEVDLRARMAAGERSPEWLFALARLAESRQRMRFGAILLEYCLDQYPADVRFIESQANILGNIGEEGAATEILEDYFSNPEAERRLLPLACRMAWRSGAYSASKNYAERWIKEDPDNHTAWLGLGKAHVKLENLAAARKALVKSVGLEKENKEAYYYLALISLLEKDPENARNWFSQYTRRASAEEIAAVLERPPFSDWQNDFRARPPEG